MNITVRSACVLALSWLTLTPVIAEDLAVGITRYMDKFEGTVNGEAIKIQRNQDQTNR